jgi:hypothetical protein
MLCFSVNYENKESDKDVNNNAMDFEYREHSACREN